MVGTENKRDCPKCGGGFMGGKIDCPTCDGKGRVGSWPNESPCPNGYCFSGKIDCPTCHGKGYVD